MLSASSSTRKAFEALKYRIDQEVLFQKEAFRLLGSLDTILTAATATQRHSAAALGGVGGWTGVLPSGPGAALEEPSVLGVGGSSEHRTAVHVVPNQTH